MEINIRKSRIDDLDELIILQENNETILSPKILDDTILDVEKIFLVAHNYKLLVGYIACDIGVDTADITAVLVDKCYRNLKVATILMNHLIFYLKKMSITEVFLEVKSSNTNAINFYTKHGFKYVSKRANYYKDDDAFVYKKILK